MLAEAHYEPPILPGAALGVLGSGQLGRMFAIAARRLGYRVHALSPDDDTPTGQVADLEISAHYDDLDAVARFARRSVVTFEFENVPAAAAEPRPRSARPPGGQCSTSRRIGCGRRRFLAARLPGDALRGVGPRTNCGGGATIGPPPCSRPPTGVTTARGRSSVKSNRPPAEAWRSLGDTEGVLEGCIDFDTETVGCRGAGSTATSRQLRPVRHTPTGSHSGRLRLPGRLPARSAGDTEDIAQACSQGRPRRRRGPLRRVLPEKRAAADQRVGPPAAELRASDARRPRELPVRLATSINPFRPCCTWPRAIRTISRPP